MLPIYGKEKDFLQNSPHPLPSAFDMMISFAAERKILLRDEVIRAMRSVDREAFLLPCFAQITSIDEKDAQMATMYALLGFPAPIWVDPDGEVTNSTAVPLVATMISEGLQAPGRTRALIIGSGCGFAPAIVSTLGFGSVVGIEIRSGLAATAQQTLKDNGFNGVQIVSGDAADWVKKHWRTFDMAISFAAIPDDPSGRGALRTFFGSLNEGGVLVTPFGPPEHCPITVFTQGSQEGDIQSRIVLPNTAFTPFITP